MRAPNCMRCFVLLIVVWLLGFCDLGSLGCCPVVPGVHIFLCAVNLGLVLVVFLLQRHFEYEMRVPNCTGCFILLIVVFSFYHVILTYIFIFQYLMQVIEINPSLPSILLVCTIGRTRKMDDCCVPLV